MASTAEKTIMDTLKAAIALRAVPIAQGAAVRIWSDQASDIHPPEIVCKCGQRTRIEPNFPLYKFQAEVWVATKVADDQSQATLDVLDADVLAYVGGLTAAALATATGLSVNGIVMGERPDRELLPEHTLFIQRTPFTMFLTIT